VADPTPTGDSVARDRFSPSAMLAIGLALLFGLSASIIGFRIVRAGERARAKSALEVETREQATEIRRAFDALGDQLHSIAALYYSSKEVEHGEFKSFVAHGLARRAAPLNLLWIERVPAAKRAEFEAAGRDAGLKGFEFRELSTSGTLVPAAPRDEYWVNWFIEPATNGASVSGFDQASDPRRLAGLQRSRDTDDCVLIGPAPGSGEMLAALPVFGTPGATGKDSLRGFVAAAFPLRETIEAALAVKRVPGLVVRVSDASLPPDEQLLHATRAVARTDGDPDSEASAVVPILGREWTITGGLEARQAAAAISGLSWGVLGAGLLVTLLLALSIASATSRASLQRLVDARTIQLQVRNQSLVQEIHEHALTLADLRASQKRTECILDSALDALIIMDGSGLVIGWNPKAEEMFGWLREEVLKGSMAELIIPPEHREAHRLGVQRYLATGKGPLVNRRIEITALTRDGRRLPVELSIAPLKQGEKVVAFSAFLRDISGRKHAELRQAELVRELERRLASPST